MAAKKAAKGAKGAKKGAKGAKSDSGAEGAQVGDAIDAGKAVAGLRSATGQEAARRAGQEEIPSGADRGSTVEITGEAVADYSGNEVQEPDGLQAEPAEFVSNGSLAPNMVASNSGLQPIGSVASTPEDAEKVMETRAKTLEEERKGAFAYREPLDDDKIASMSGAELRAVATDRGYDISNAAGTRGTRSAFRTAQGEDKSFSKNKGK